MLKSNQKSEIRNQSSNQIGCSYLYTCTIEIRLVESVYICAVVSSVPRRIHCMLPTIAADIQHSSFTIGIVIAAIQNFSSDYIQ